MTITRSLALALLISIALPSSVFAATKPPAVSSSAPSSANGPKPLAVAAWLPYWRKTSGAADAMSHLSQIQELSPFAYEVRADGSLVDRMKLDQDPWPGLLAAARAQNVKIIPTISWVDGDAIHALLKSTKLRQAQVATLSALAKDNGFDGIDIDYENKKSETKIYFSKFLKELAAALHKQKKLLVCSIEPRTPLADRTTTAQGSEPRTRPAGRDDAGLMYANDYKVIGQACDRVRIMAYDQSRIDLKLNTRKGAQALYFPVADPDWAIKVIRETLLTIPRNKIELGIPTYGYEHGAKNASSTAWDYRRIQSVSYQDAWKLAADVGAAPTRSGAGELVFRYATSTLSVAPPAVATSSLDPSVPTSLATSSPAATTPFLAARIVNFTDAQAIADKVKLARRFNLRGVAIFKIDGEGDPNMWQVLR